MLLLLCTVIDRKGEEEVQKNNPIAEVIATTSGGIKEMGKLINSGFLNSCAFANHHRRPMMPLSTVIIGTGDKKHIHDLFMAIKESDH